MWRGGKWQAERARRGVLKTYMLAMVSVQCRLVGNDSSAGAACWRRRRGLSPTMQAWSSGVGCIGRGYVGFSRGAFGFGHEQATSMGSSVGRVCGVIARLMPCRTVCGASEMDACTNGNAVHALGVHGACSTGSERGRLRGLRPVGAAGVDWAVSMVSRGR
jgi:hypothetical protein